MAAEFIVLGILPALLLAAAVSDIVSFKIPNFLQGALIAAFVAYAAAAGLSWPAMGWHAVAGICGLIVGFAFFALGWVGGGDAKLFAAVALWLGFADLPTYALVASVLGGGLTLALLALRRFPLPAFLGDQGWLLRLHDEKAGIPYGVALAAGAFFILPQTEIFLHAAVLGL
jgi:prepilin peptidase CpaA